MADEWLIPRQGVLSSSSSSKSEGKVVLAFRQLVKCVWNLTTLYFLGAE